MEVPRSGEPFRDYSTNGRCCLVSVIRLASVLLASYDLESDQIFCNKRVCLKAFSEFLYVIFSFLLLSESCSDIACLSFQSSFFVNAEVALKKVFYDRVWWSRLVRQLDSSFIFHCKD